MAGSAEGEAREAGAALVHPAVACDLPKRRFFTGKGARRFKIGRLGLEQTAMGSIASAAHERPPCVAKSAPYPGFEMRGRFRLETAPDWWPLALAAAGIAIGYTTAALGLPLLPVLAVTLLVLTVFGLRQWRKNRR